LRRFRYKSVSAHTNLSLKRLPIHLAAEQRKLPGIRSPSPKEPDGLRRFRYKSVSAQTNLSLKRHPINLAAEQRKLPGIR
jgi:hypothetical protein